MKKLSVIACLMLLSQPFSTHAMMGGTDVETSTSTTSTGATSSTTEQKVAISAVELEAMRPEVGARLANIKKQMDELNVAIPSANEHLIKMSTTFATDVNQLSTLFAAKKTSNSAAPAASESSTQPPQEILIFQSKLQALEGQITTIENATSWIYQGPYLVAQATLMEKAIEVLFTHFTMNGVTIAPALSAQDKNLINYLVQMQKNLRENLSNYLDPAKMGIKLMALEFRKNAELCLLSLINQSNEVNYETTENCLNIVLNAWENLVDSAARHDCTMTNDVRTLVQKYSSTILEKINTFTEESDPKKRDNSLLVDIMNINQDFAKSLE